MKKLFLKICKIAVILFLLPLVSLAQTNNVFCSKSGYTIETINGIFTKEGSPKGLDGAVGNMNSLKSHLAIITYNGEPLTFDYLYNPTHSFLDLSDTAIQKTFEGVDMKDPDFLKILTDASAQIKTQKVLLVAHSQGNFYANNFYDAVTKSGDVPARSIGVYGVATPASRVAGNGTYRTSSTDGVINLVRKVFPGRTLEANDTIEFKKSDDSGNGHGFREVYLEYRGGEIKKEIEESLGRLLINSTRSEDGLCINPPEKLSTVDKITRIVIYPADFTIAFGATGINVAKNIIVAVASGTYNLTVAAGTSVASTVSSFLGWLNNNGGNNLADSNGAAVLLATTNTADDNSSDGILTDQTPEEISGGISSDETSNVEIDNTIYDVIYNSPSESSGDTGGDTGQSSSGSEPPAVKHIVVRPSSGGAINQPQIPVDNNDNTATSTPETPPTPPEESTATSTPEIPPTEPEVPTEATSTPPIVIPSDTTPPVITILGRNPATIAIDTNYTDLGATAQDEIDGSRPVATSGIVDTTIAGAYLITYTASDLSHNTATSTRAVNVVATIPGPATPSDLNGNGIPDSQEEDVVVTSNVSLPAGEYNFNNLTITNNATVTAEGDENSADSFKGVKINAINLTITSGSSISADRNGYGTGPGAGGWQSGASYGGVGHGNPASSTYGSAMHPLDLGSIGARKGGGAIRLAISGILQNDGVVSATGDASGSGGSIFVTTNTLKGAGAFQANGGGLFAIGYFQGPGGGGRVAIYYQSSLFNGTAEAKGGCGSYDGWTLTCAAPGTVGLFDVPNNNLRIDKSFRFQKNDSPLSFDHILVTDGAQVESEDDANVTANELLVENGSSLSLANNQTLTITNMIIDGASTLTVSGSESLNVQNLTIRNGNSRILVPKERILTLSVANLNIGSGTSVIADGKGYDGGMGPGTPTNAQGGASYGGVGYCSSVATYGSMLNPTDFGSGGARSGGGAIRIIVTGAFVNDGVVSAVGSPSGSGGSIFVTANTLAGSGVFNANGGSLFAIGYYQGPGGGGRIAIRYGSSSFSGTVEAKGGCWDPASCAGNGTIVVEANNATYPIAATAGENGTITPNGITNVSVGANQTYTFEPAPGYEVEMLKADGLSVATSTPYIFNEIISAHTIDVTFSEIPVPSPQMLQSLTPMLGSLGTISALEGNTEIKNDDNDDIETATISDDKTPDNNPPVDDTPIEKPLVEDVPIEPPLSSIEPSADDPTINILPSGDTGVQNPPAENPPPETQ